MEIALHPQLNYFIGENGAGKTSVLEALVVLAKGRSFRSGQVGALIGPESEQFRIVTRTGAPDHAEQTLGIERSRKDWTARHNRGDVAQLSDLAEHLPLVIIEPNSHLLISGPPDGRRRFVDWGVFHVEPRHLVHWRRYARALKQRNAALRQRNQALVTSLDPVLSELGEALHAARASQCERLFQILQNTLEELNPGLRMVALDYRSGWAGGQFRHALEEATERDMERGVTGPGPHRGDIALDYDGNPAREILSRGEQKILATALLLSQAQMMTDAGKTPLLLMDDLASEFDEAHLGRVMAFGERLGAQMWVTGTSLEAYPAPAPERAVVFHVEQGQLSTKTNA